MKLATTYTNPRTGRWYVEEKGTIQVRLDGPDTATIIADRHTIYRVDGDSIYNTRTKREPVKAAEFKALADTARAIDVQHTA